MWLLIQPFGLNNWVSDRKVVFFERKAKFGLIEVVRVVVIVRVPKVRIVKVVVLIG